MSKKDSGQRAYAHARYEQKRLAAIAASKDKPALSAEMARAAALFAVTTNPQGAAELTGLKVMVLTKIANGQFTARGGEQIDVVINAATAMGWKP